MKRMILHADHTSQLGGAEIWLYNQLNRLGKLNINVGVLFGDKGPIFDKTMKLNIPTFYAPIPKIKSIKEFFESITAVRKIIRENNVSVVHCHSFRSNIIVGISGRLERKNVIWHIHETLERPQVSFVNYWIMKILIRFIPNYVVANSKYTLDTLGVKSKFQIVYPAISLNTYNPEENVKIDKGIINIMILGRIARWKGQHIFIKAASIICEQRKDIRFLVAGAPIFNQQSYELELKQLVNELNLNEFVKFLGHVDDVPRLLNETDIAVHCSIEPEPFGQVIIQAMASGKPMIATAHGGPLEIIDDRINGILVDPNNEQALADKILELLNNKQLMSSIGKNAIQKVKIFSDEVQDKKMLNIYEEMGVL